MSNQDNVLTSGPAHNVQEARNLVEFYSPNTPSIQTIRLQHGVRVMMLLGAERVYAEGEDEQSATEACYLKAAQRLELFAPEEWKDYMTLKAACDSMMNKLIKVTPHTHLTVRLLLTSHCDTLFQQYRDVMLNSAPM